MLVHFNVVFILNAVNEAAFDQTHKMIKEKIVAKGLHNELSRKKEWKLQPD